MSQSGLLANIEIIDSLHAHLLCTEILHCTVNNFQEFFSQFITEATSIAPTQCTQADSDTGDHITTVTVTLTDTVTCAETSMNNDSRVTVMVTTTSVVPCRQESSAADQSSDYNGSRAVWVVMAILFLVIAVSAIVSSTFLGYLLHKKVKSQGNVNIAASGTNTNRSVGEGEISDIYVRR